MPTMTEHEPGTFCWLELATTDAKRAKAFYGELFGWAFNDMPVGGGMTYSLAQLDGKDVAGVYQLGAGAIFPVSTNKH